MSEGAEENFLWQAMLFGSLIGSGCHGLDISCGLGTFLSTGAVGSMLFPDS